MPGKVDLVAKNPVVRAAHPDVDRVSVELVHRHLIAVLDSELNIVGVVHVHVIQQLREMLTAQLILLVVLLTPEP